MFAAQLTVRVRIEGGGACTGTGPTECTGRIAGTKLTSVSRLGGTPAGDADATRRRLSAQREDDASGPAKEAPVAGGAVEGKGGGRVRVAANGMFFRCAHVFRSVSDKKRS